MIIRNLFLMALALTYLGCGGDSGDLSTQDSSRLPSVEGEPIDRDPKTTLEIPAICSALNFENVTWPVDYTTNDEMAFALAINITGSFEGHSGWTNLSNNFDGQGVSMGILNQNLGQGTLQPLFINMRDRNLSVLQNAMTQPMLDSLLKMLSDWERAGGNIVPANVDLSDPTDQREWIVNREEGVDKAYGFRGVQLASNSASVSWAKKTLYSDKAAKNFKPEWKDALKAIAGHPAYISQQIEAAQYIHDRAMEYRDRLGWGQLRSYLYLFDIVVQNGSLKDKHFEAYDAWLSKQTGATEEEQMLEMLNIRVKDVLKQWQQDVLSRKRAVISGTGFVHGENRNLPVEYCYDPIFSY